MFWLLKLNKTLIAACGMNCGICIAYLREKNKCAGCRNDNKHKTKSRIKCIIKNCELLVKTHSRFCYDCIKYPCTRLKQLDKRYRKNYNMSMIENLDNIKKFGLDKFVKMKYDRWICNNCGGTICVNRGYCLNCKEK